MIFSLQVGTKLLIRNFRPDSSVNGSKMREADIVVGDDVIPCIIRCVSNGNIRNASLQHINASITIFQRCIHTAHTKKGFIDVMITSDICQFSVYIHRDKVKQFLGACAMSIIKEGLNL